VKKSFFDQMVVNKGSMLTLPPLCFPIGKEKKPATSANAGAGGGGAPMVASETSSSGHRPTAVPSTTFNRQASVTQAPSLNSPTGSGVAIVGKPKKGTKRLIRGMDRSKSERF